MFHKTRSLFCFYLVIVLSSCGQNDFVTVNLITPFQQKTNTRNLMKDLASLPTGRSNFLVPNYCKQADLMVGVMNGPIVDANSQPVMSINVPVYTDFTDIGSETDMLDTYVSSRTTSLNNFIAYLGTVPSAIQMGPIQISIPKGKTTGVGLFGTMRPDYTPTAGINCKIRADITTNNIGDIWEWASYLGSTNITAQSSGASYSVPLEVAPRIARVTVSNYFDVLGTPTICAGTPSDVISKTVFNTVDPNPKNGQTRGRYLFVHAKLPSVAASPLTDFVQILVLLGNQAAPINLIRNASGLSSGSRPNNSTYILRGIGDFCGTNASGSNDLFMVPAIYPLTFRVLTLAGLDRCIPITISGPSEPLIRYAEPAVASETGYLFAEINWDSCT